MLEVLLNQLAKAMEASAVDIGAAEEVSSHTILLSTVHQLCVTDCCSIATMLILQLLSQAQNSLCGQLFDFLTNRYATHVARRLLCIMAGRNVLPLAAKSQNKVCRALSRLLLSMRH